MTDTLSPLIADRSELLGQICELDDFQPGSITNATRRCGKPSCHCTKPDHPGHGPHFQLTQKINRKTATQNLPSPAAVRKAQSEIAEYRKFRALVDELVAVNRRICRLRPVEQSAQPEQAAQEKNGRGDPPRSHTRTRPTVARDLQGPPQDGPSRSGSHRDGGALGHASGRGSGLGRTAAIPSPGRRLTQRSLFLRSSGALQGVALQAASHRSGRSESLAPLLPVPALP